MLSIITVTLIRTKHASLDFLCEIMRIFRESEIASQILTFFSNKKRVLCLKCTSIKVTGEKYVSAQVCNHSAVISSGRDILTTATSALHLFLEVGRGQLHHVSTRVHGKEWAGKTLEAKNWWLS